MEMCRIAAFQRVTIKQQTPDLQREMIKRSAVQPEVRRDKTMTALRNDLKLTVATTSMTLGVSCKRICFFTCSSFCSRCRCRCARTC